MLRIAGMALSILVCAGAASPDAGPAPPIVEQVTVGVGQQKILPIGAIAKMAVSDPSVCDAKGMSSGHALLLVGASAGHATITVTRMDGQVRIWEVTVTPIPDGGYPRPPPRAPTYDERFREQLRPRFEALHRCAETLGPPPRGESIQALTSVDNAGVIHAEVLNARWAPCLEPLLRGMTAPGFEGTRAVKVIPVLYSDQRGW